jgi:Uma2 family endonuclease
MNGTTMSATTLPTAVPQEPPMTAEEFLAKYGDESGVELVKGRVVRYPMTSATIPTPVPATPLMTAEEFLTRHGGDMNVELVKGQVMRYPMPGGKHGEVCVNATLTIGGFVKANDLGRVMSNDTFIRTTDAPTTFRGADVCFISYKRLPKDRETPSGPLSAPELVVEVRSPTDRLKALSDKAYEYLDSGVVVVVLLIPEKESAAIFRQDNLPVQLAPDDELTLPDALPGFAVPVRKFFE